MSISEVYPNQKNEPDINLADSSGFAEIPQDLTIAAIRMTDFDLNWLGTGQV
jgi:hypothetical protein